MTPIVGVLAVIGALLLAVVRALVVDEAKGRLQRRIAADVEATIASLPPDLQEEWGEEWRADLDALRSMPFAALVYAHNLRRSGRTLIAERVPSPVATAAVPRSRRPGLGARAVQRMTRRVAGRQRPLGVVSRDDLERVKAVQVRIAPAVIGAGMVVVALDDIGPLQIVALILMSSGLSVALFERRRSRR